MNTFLQVLSYLNGEMPRGGATSLTPVYAGLQADLDAFLRAFLRLESCRFIHFYNRTNPLDFKIRWLQKTFQSHRNDQVVQRSKQQCRNHWGSCFLWVQTTPVSRISVQRTSACLLSTVHPWVPQREREADSGGATVRPVLYVHVLLSPTDQSRRQNQNGRVFTPVV